MTFPILGANGAGAEQYPIDNSLRFNDGDSAYLTRTNSAGNRKTWTWSSWVKRGDIPSSGSQQFIFTSNNTSNYSSMYFDESTSRFNFYNYSGGGYVDRLETNAVYRDASAWYHFFIKHDSTQATEADRLELYVNGVKVTSFATANYPTLNYDSFMNVSGYNNIIGRQQVGDSALFDGYIAETHFIDGQALSPTDFGEFSEEGIWKPIEYTGTYGTNGVYLDFEDSGSLGADQSGNGNNFTPNNFTATDQTTDTPTNNFATLNPLAKTGIAGVPYDGNLSHVGQTSGYSQTVFGTIVIPAGTGKWYWESKTTGKTTGGIGVVATDVIDGSDYTATYTTSSTAVAPWTYNYGWGVLTSTGNKVHDGTSSSYSTGDLNQVRQCAMDCENGKIYFGVNNVWGDSGDPAAGTNPAYTDTDLSTKNIIPFSVVSDTDGRYRHMNFGNPNAGFNETTNESDENGFGKFKYAPPSGYLALCTQNLATELEPTIDDGSAYFYTQLYTGTGSALSITNDANAGNFQPDWIWLKSRNNATNHNVFDSSRGETNRVYPNLIDAEDTVSGFTLDTNGFSTGTSSVGDINVSGKTYVAWQWKANAGSTSSNTDGDVTSTVQVNSIAGFSIVTWTSTGGNESIGHGLGVVPAMFITKNRSAGANWKVYHHKDTSAPETNNTSLNKTDPTQDDINAWNDTAPTSTTFTVGIDAGSGGSSGNNMVAYCFAEIEGYSKFGSYTGNGSSDGPFVYTGFKPAFTLIKRTDATQAWVLHDSARAGYINPTDNYSYANATNVEAEDIDHDYLSNGFKIRSTFNDTNASGGTYIFMAFAENPFVSSTAIPVTAR